MKHKSGTMSSRKSGSASGSENIAKMHQAWQLFSFISKQNPTSYN
jgi:hypothetical protein